MFPIIYLNIYLNFITQIFNYIYLQFKVMIFLFRQDHEAKIIFD